jgi:hypothetical protein
MKKSNFNTKNGMMGILVIILLTLLSLSVNAQVFETKKSKKQEIRKVNIIAQVKDFTFKYEGSNLNAYVEVRNNYYGTFKVRCTEKVQIGEMIILNGFITRSNKFIPTGYKTQRNNIRYKYFFTYGKHIYCLLSNNQIVLFSQIPIYWKPVILATNVKLLNMGFVGRQFSYLNIEYFDFCENENDRNIIELTNVIDGRVYSSIRYK